MSVTAAQGFTAAGIHAGVKEGDALDLALVASSSGPIAAAAVFTQSLTEAAPVTLSREHIADGRAHAVVLNSGCANAGTGVRGAAAAHAMAVAVGKALSTDPTNVVVCSTGAIGPELPVSLPDGATALVAALDTVNHTLAAEAILTTDTFTKEAVVKWEGWVIGGMAKGAGMIRPNMATMLSVLTTDAVVSSDVLQSTLIASVRRTFNCLNIDGCQSTNDAVILMASGASGIAPDLDVFEAALATVCFSLARQMAEDAEGASRVVTLNVSGAANARDAHQLGMAVANSALVRCSFYGGDPNWGRVYGALGVAGVSLAANEVSIAYNGMTVAHGGGEAPFDRDSLLADLAEGEIIVDIVVGHGPGSASIVTTDLTPEYVTFNGEPS